MNKVLSFSAFFLFLVLSSFGKKKDPAADHFMLEGKILEINLANGEDKPAVSVQIVVYQDKDIFVSFYSNSDGNYEFLLPVGHEYEVWFGGSAFVNKRVYIDSRKCPISKAISDIELDMGLFRPVEGVDFTPLNDVFVRMNWNDEFGQFEADMAYTEAKSKELEKIFKKIKKSGQLKS